MIRFLKIFFGTVFTLLILIGSCVFYAFKIEPYRIASNQLLASGDFRHSESDKKRQSQSI